MKSKLTMIVLSLSLVLLASCEEREWAEAGFSGKGVMLTFSAPGMPTVQSRALSTEEESRVQDLYVLMFDADDSDGGNPVKYRFYFSGSDLKGAGTNQPHTNAGQVFLKGVEPGRYYLVGIANIQSGVVEGDKLRLQLDAIKNLVEYEGTDGDSGSVRVALKNPQDIHRVVPALCMAGVYNINNENHTTAGVAVVEGNKALSGMLHLRRVDSRIKFVVENAAPERIKKFEPVSWQVFNIPTDVHVTDDNETSGEYVDSELQIKFDKSVANKPSFEFYMPENMQKAKEKITWNNGDVLKDKFHERERKNCEGGFTYAADNATYVKIRANLEIAMPAEGDNPAFVRTAEVEYTVHLGYCEGNTDEKLNDFNSRRNTKYLYTVKVKSVDEIVLEAKKENEDGAQPGAEGIVTDAVGGEQITVDAHYSVFNIRLNPREIRTLGYLMRTPFGEYQKSPSSMDDKGTFDAGNEDCTWIKFAETENMETLVSYADTRDTKAEADADGKKWLMNLEELGRTYGDDTDSKDKFFTVFINEYVYQNKAPRDYVNKKARELFLYTGNDVSTDKNSIYITGKYHIAQRSIQTYYRSDSPSLYGVEHLDETKGYNLNWGITDSSPGTNHEVNETKNWNPDDGWNNVGNGSKGNKDLGVVGKRWSDFALMTNPDKKKHRTFQMKAGVSRDFGKREEAEGENEFHEILYTCLSRNRDLNRNDIIDADELRWYLPGLNQYIMIYMGAAALETPLFDASSIPPEAGNNAQMNCRNDYHFATSDCQKIFAEQGSSSNNPHWSNDGGNKWARNVRCIRNLHETATGGGTDLCPEASQKLPTSPYEVDENACTVSMSHYNPLCLRQTSIPGGAWLSLHHNFDYAVNSPYKKFRYAKNKIPINGGNWIPSLDGNTYVSEYSEGADDRGKWRYPNQRELNLLWMAGICKGPSPANKYVSASKWKYDSRFCLADGNVLVLSGPDGYVRPVMDVEE